MSQYADYANGHMYPGGYKPSNEVSQITTAIRGIDPAPSRWSPPRPATTTP